MCTIDGLFGNNMMMFIVGLMNITTNAMEYFSGPRQDYTYQEALNYCASQGTTLASIHSLLDFDNAKSECNKTIGNNWSTGCWIGLSDILEENSFIWEDGTVSDFIFPWAGGQPDNDNEEHCVQLWAFDNYYFNDKKCEQEWSFPLCNKITLQPTSSPTLYYTETPTNNWIISSKLLPRGDANMAIAEYKDFIFILGGWHHRKQCVIYDIVNDSFIDYGYKYLRSEVTGTSQYYTYHDNIIYMIHPSGDRLSIFNMKTKLLDSHWNGLTIPIDTTDIYQSACLASNNNFLFILGGDGNFGVMERDEFQILNITGNNFKWLSKTPSLNTHRAALSCIFHTVTNSLYAIGGRTRTDAKAFQLDTIEIIDVANVDNIQNMRWNFNDDRLLYPAQNLKTVIYGNYLIFIGGMNNNHGDISTTQIMDVTNGKIKIIGDLLYATQSPAVIIIKNILYVFGGNIANLSLWQYKYLNEFSTDPTTNPTISPSINPTSNPSVNPTINPSTTPTVNPSTTPTVNPSIYLSTLSEILFASDTKEFETENINKFTFKLILTICITFILLSIIDYLHSEYSFKYNCRTCMANGCYKSDQYNFRLILKVLLRVTDLITDIVFAYIMIKEYLNNKMDYQLLVLACGSVIFLIVPYFINLVSMGSIPKLSNILIDRPTIWFSKYMYIFVLFVIITGDCYVSTLIISSNIFGTNIY
eukprot:261569_1